MAKRYSVSNPEVTRAIRRLAFFTDVIGEAKMTQYTSTTKDLNYTPGMFPRMRPGQDSAPPPQGLPRRCQRSCNEEGEGHARFSSTYAILALAISTGLSSVACGGAATAKGPVAPEPAAVQAAPSPGPAAAGEQFAIPDAPTNRESASTRPKMNAAAEAAYNAGMDAFKKGDLVGAKNQFTRATQADPQAYQAFYSLGVVRERTNETSGALSSYRQATLVVSDYEPAILAYAVLLARTGKPEEALAFLEQRKAAMPKSAAVTAAQAEANQFRATPGRRNGLPRKR